MSGKTKQACSSVRDTSMDSTPGKRIKSPGRSSTSGDAEVGMLSRLSEPRLLVVDDEEYICEVISDPYHQ